MFPESALKRQKRLFSADYLSDFNPGIFLPTIGVLLSD